MIVGFLPQSAYGGVHEPYRLPASVWNAGCPVCGGAGSLTSALQIDTAHKTELGHIIFQPKCTVGDHAIIPHHLES